MRNLVSVFFCLQVCSASLLPAQVLPSEETEKLLWDLPLSSVNLQKEHVSTIFVQDLPNGDLNASAFCEWSYIDGRCSRLADDKFMALDVPLQISHEEIDWSRLWNTERNDQMHPPGKVKDFGPWISLGENREINGQLVPFMLPDTLLIQVSPNISGMELEDLISDYELTIIEKLPEIGTLKAQTDLSKFFSHQLSDTSPNDALIRGLEAIRIEYSKDPRIQSVSPDILLFGEQDGTNVLSARNKSLDDMEGDQWGLIDIEVKSAWGEIGATDGIIFGVLDVGFARHKDITYSRLNSSTAHDHGNHVAGIACARHNGYGILGVLPNCFVRAESAQSISNSAKTDALFTLTSLSASVGALNRLVGDQQSIRTFNVSLGINWALLKINPDAPESEVWRNQIEQQANFIVSIYERALQNDQVIFSAAGNDGGYYSPTVRAKYASPFNFAAIDMWDRGLRSGVVVQAHGPDGNRATFSNTGGHISCPGVDIRSLVATNLSDDVVDNLYGDMSGTSMAAPFCSAAHSLLSLIRPNYTSLELVDCMTNSSVAVDGTVPALKLSQSLSACPRRTDLASKEAVQQ